MYSVIRQYAAAGAIGDLLVERTSDVRELISSTPGFVAYSAVRDGEHVTTITVCADQAGTEETTRRAAAFIKEHLPTTTIGAPTIRQGEVVVSFP